MKKNKILALLIAAATALVSGANALALDYGAEWANYEKDNNQIYSDVPSDHWAFDAIKRSSDVNWFNGYPDGTFKPNNKINRAEGMKVFVTFLGLKLETVTETSYHDVKPTDWYAPYIEAGKKLYIQKPAFNGDIPFNPNMPLTREDAIHALVIALKYNNEVEFADQSILNMFKDANSISASLKPYVAVAVDKGLVAGMNDGTIRAQDPLTRAQFATLLYRASTIGYGTGGGLSDIEEPTQPSESDSPGILTINVTPTEKTINVGESFNITATAVMSNGTTSDYTSNLVMTANNACVTIAGNAVTGAQAGEALISFTGSDVLANTTVKVKVNQTNNNQVVSNGKVNGKVAYADRPDTGIAGATVKFFKDNAEVKSVLTDVNGQYEADLEVGNYRITANYQDYKEGQTTVEIVVNETAYASVILLTNDQEGTIAGKVYDAFVQDGIISGAKIVFRAGGDVQTGEIVAETTSDAQGHFSVNLSAGTYTAEASKEGYITAYKNCVSQVAEVEQNITLTPVLGEGEWRFVLTWGEHPYDLDSHLTGPNGNNRFHVFFHDKVARSGSEELANLDVDDITSYGPETITIVKKDDGVYRYSVHDYTNRGKTDSKAMSNSGATVKVYNGSNLLKTFNVPTNVVGTVWTVFELNGNTIVPKNEISNESNAGAIASEETESDINLIKNVPEK